MKCNEIIKALRGLKSNMDRFIEKHSILLLINFASLKSNMDRFIVTTTILYAIKIIV